VRFESSEIARNCLFLPLNAGFTGNRFHDFEACFLHSFFITPIMKLSSIGSQDKFSPPRPTPKADDANSPDHGCDA
jgi:hypothetical protein